MSGSEQAFRPTYYKIDGRRIEWGELRGNNSLLACIICWPLTKLNVPCGPNDDPAIDSVISLEVQSQSVPPDVLARMTPLLMQLQAMGFVDPLFYYINEPINGGTYTWAVCRHSSGRQLVRLCHRVHHASSAQYFYQQAISVLQGGDFVVTSTGLPESFMPPEVELVSLPPRTPLDALLHRHDQALGARPLTRLMTDDETAQTVESLHVSITQFHVDRGVYHLPRQLPRERPLEPQPGAMPPMQGMPAQAPQFSVPPQYPQHPQAAPQPKPLVASPHPQAQGHTQPQPMMPAAPPGALPAGQPVAATMPPPPAYEPEVEAKVQSIVAKVLEPPTPKSLRSRVFWLVVTLVAFAVLGWRFWGWQAVAMILPILLFHELGHWIAMKVFGYRDVRMFFLPLLGAAVAGRPPRIEGWKPVVVALAGPLPGIALAGVLAIVHGFYEHPLLFRAAELLLIINAFNLLPVLPFDGGRVVHALVCSRFFVLDVVFRVLTVAALVGLGLLIGWRFLAILGALMFLSIFSAYTVGRVVDRLRPRLRPQSFDDDGTPEPDLVYAILHELDVRPALRRGGKTQVERVTAQVREVVQSLAIRPPGAGASVLLGGVYAGSVLSIFVVGVIMIITSLGPGGLGALAGLAQGSSYASSYAGTDTYAIDLAAVERSGSTALLRPMAESITFAATFDDPAAMQQMWDQLVMQQNDTRRLLRFGRTIFVEAAKDDAGLSQLKDELSQSAKDVFEHTHDNRVWVTLEGKLSEAESARANRELTAYNYVSLHRDVIAPWDEAGMLTDKQIRARDTYAQLMDLMIDYDDAELQKIHTRLSKATDPAMMQALSARRAERIAELEAQAHQSLLAEHGETLDQEVFALCQRKPELDFQMFDGDYQSVAFHAKANEHGVAYDAWERELAEHLGRRMQPDDGQPRDDEDIRDPQAVYLDAFSAGEGEFGFYGSEPFSPIDSLAAIAVWLNDKQAADVTYSLAHSGMTQAERDAQRRTWEAELAAESSDDLVEEARAPAADETVQTTDAADVPAQQAPGF